MTYDSASWGALALALTILGGVVTWARWRSRGLASGLRGTGVSLLPIAAWMTGTLRLVVDIASSVSSWAAHLVFSPLVWLGICVAGVAVLLFGVGTALQNRRAGPEAVTHGKQRPKLGRRSKPKQKPAADVEGMDDIEAILRKHGIS